MQLPGTGYTGSFGMAIPRLSGRSGKRSITSIVYMAACNLFRSRFEITDIIKSRRFHGCQNVVEMYHFSRVSITTIQDVLTNLLSHSLIDCFF
jgi:hypothetical protein